MPIDGIAPRLRELGRLKFGEDLGDRPTQLRTWRLTSDNVELIESAAQQWGGTVTLTDRGAEVTTDADAIEVLVPPQDVSAGQWFELWTKGGLQRRCSGRSLVVYDEAEPSGYRETGPCICTQENVSGARQCKITTMLRVMLPHIPDLGVWRLTTRSYYAARELLQATDFLLKACGPDNAAPAVLGLDVRSTKRPGEGKREFVVPVLRTRSTLAALLQGEAAAPLDAPALPPARDIEPPPVELPDEILDALADPGVLEEWEAAQTEAPGPWDELATFLAETDTTALPGPAAGLIELLERLEQLMVTTRLWEATDDGRGPLDVAAERWLLGVTTAEWRDGGIITPKLRTFAVRALLAAAADFAKHAEGRSAAAAYETRTP